MLLSWAWLTDGQLVERCGETLCSYDGATGKRTAYFGEGLECINRHWQSRFCRLRGWGSRLVLERSGEPKRIVVDDRLEPLGLQKARFLIYSSDGMHLAAFEPCEQLLRREEGEEPAEGAPRGTCIIDSVSGAMTTVPIALIKRQVLGMHDGWLLALRWSRSGGPPEVRPNCALLKETRMRVPSGARLAATRAWTPGITAGSRWTKQSTAWSQVSRSQGWVTTSATW